MGLLPSLVQLTHVCSHVQRVCRCRETNVCTGQVVGGREWTPSVEDYLGPTLGFRLPVQSR